jgi:hypothetical protein
MQAKQIYNAAISKKAQPNYILQCSPVRTGVPFNILIPLCYTYQGRSFLIFQASSGIQPILTVIHDHTSIKCLDERMISGRVFVIVMRHFCRNCCTKTIACENVPGRRADSLAMTT